MVTIPAPSVPLSKVGRAADDIGLAGLLGGNLFGRLAMHPSVTEISDTAERGKVVNAAWRRYGTVDSLSLAAVVTGWTGARVREAADGELSAEERRLAYAEGRARRARRGHGAGHGGRRDALRPHGPGRRGALQDGDRAARQRPRPPNAASAA